MSSAEVEGGAPVKLEDLPGYDRSPCTVENCTARSGWLVERAADGEVVPACDRHVTDLLYPEHARLLAVKVESQAVGEFLETQFDRGFVMAKYKGDRLIERHRPIADWLAEFFQIDQSAIEAEKRRMLERLVG